MNILVIGNGFDLAHGLPTRYTEFLEFIESFKDCYEKVQDDQIDWVYYDTNNRVNFFLKKWFSSYYENENGQSKEEKAATVKIIDEFYDNINENFWIDYFLQCDMHGKENWIDFESEISALIKSLDKDIHDAKRSLYDHIDIRFSNDYIDCYDRFQKCDTFKEIKDILERDLNALIRAFEIYLTEYIEKISITDISPDIKEIVRCSATLNGLRMTISSHIINFNYTNTYEKVYWKEKSTIFRDRIDYIHGMAKDNNTIEENNMVLGIDEYLGKKKRNKYIEFISFKKFYQRIYKKTGCKYKEWVDEIRKSEESNSKWKYENTDYFKNNFHNLFFFGHSLDITDKDVLKNLILNNNVYTTIFYHDKNAMGQQIANLVKVIGQDELIRRTGGKNKLLEFKPQKPMETIENI